MSLGGATLASGTEGRLIVALDQALVQPARVARVSGGVFVCRQRFLSPEDRREAQPGLGCDGAAVSMFDGRLDNRSELIERLGLRAADIAAPDGVLVVKAYERFGADAPRYLLGDFAWALWDQREARLMLARDHSQQRALFYALGDGFVAFATSYRPLLALPQVPRDVDEQTVAEMLLTCADPGDRTFYRAIRHVGPAARVLIDERAVRSEALWRPEMQAVATPRTDLEHVEAMRSTFDAAVRSRLRIDGPIVCSVSGGLDSSAIAATAARLSPATTIRGLCKLPVSGGAEPVAADRYADERPFVDALAAAHPNLEIEYLSSNAVESFEIDPARFFLQAGMPIRAPSNAAWFAGVNRRAAELGAASLLEGSWGNVTVSADGMDHLSTLREEGRWWALTRELRALRRTLPANVWRGLVRYTLSRMLPAGVRNRLGAARGQGPAWLRNTAVNPDFYHAEKLEQQCREHSVLALDPLASGGRHAVARYMVERSRMQVESHGALRAITGITRSDPFSDRRVIDLALATPDAQFVLGGVHRSFARRVFADRLPAALLGNMRRGAQNGDWHARLTPHRDGLAAELDRLERSQLASRMLDLPKLKKVMEEWPKEREAGGPVSPRYRAMLLRSLHAGQFLRWVEGGNG